MDYCTAVAIAYFQRLGAIDSLGRGAPLAELSERFSSDFMQMQVMSTNDPIALHWGLANAHSLRSGAALGHPTAFRNETI